MGNCRSHQSRSAATAKLILLDGQLQEFGCAVRVSLLPQRNRDCFICSSEEMEFDQFVAEIGGDEALQPGEIYFELPIGWRNQRLQAEDMAALAVKASLALSRSSGCYEERKISCGFCCCVSRKIEPVTSLFGEKERPALLAAEGGGGGGGCKGRKFVAELSAIIEE